MSEKPRVGRRGRRMLRNGMRTTHIPFFKSSTDTPSPCPKTLPFRDSRESVYRILTAEARMLLFFVEILGHQSYNCAGPDRSNQLVVALEW
jgi:hypothetical protein